MAEQREFADCTSWLFAFTKELGLLSNFDGRNSVLHVPIFVSRSDSSERITYGANVRNMNERMLRTFGNITRTVMFL